jgi:hypothetical protein
MEQLSELSGILNANFQWNKAKITLLKEAKFGKYNNLI